MSHTPDILLIMSDQHAKRVAGIYGDDVAQTPNIDGLASRGVVFDNCYAPSPICTASRMSMLTAKFPHKQQVWTNDDILASGIPTYAHSLGAHGYKTILAGRLHALGPDQYHGYSARYVGDHSPNWPGIPRHDMGELAATNDPFRVSIEKSGPGTSSYICLDSDVRKSAVTQLERIADARVQGDHQPFAMTVGLMQPHPPYVAEEQNFLKFQGQVPPPKLSPPDKDAEHPWQSEWRTGREINDVSSESRERAREAYYALVYQLDMEIGRILSALETLGLSENTLVIYTSDHGDQIGERGLWWKHTFYDDSVQVPLIFAGKGAEKAIGRRNHLVDLMDVTATVLDIAGAPALPQCDGRSFKNILLDPALNWRNNVFSEYCMDRTPAWADGKAVQHRMIRSDDWKLIYYHGYPPQLFNLSDDPDELNNLADLGEFESILEALMNQLMDGWDPDAIDHLMEQLIPSKRLISGWAKKTIPEDTIRWELNPDQNSLLAMAGAGRP